MCDTGRDRPDLLDQWHDGDPERTQVHAGRAARSPERARGGVELGDREAGSGVLEVVSDHRGDTFRSVYTVRFADRVFVLHALQKKSKSGVATPKPDIDLITQRLKQAVALSKKKE